MSDSAEVSTSDRAEATLSDSDNSSDWEDVSSSDEEEIANEVYQLKITLKGIRPPIWRRILVLSSSTFAELHSVVVGSMGWLDSHLHAFQGRGLEIGTVDEEDENPDGLFDLIMLLGGARRTRKLDETQVKLSEFKKPKDSIKYLYDFGDNWLHSIVLEKILPDDGRPYPFCIAGERACPPDDCGGVHGYQRLLGILADPNHEEHEDMKEWMNDLGKEDFDPETFDIHEVRMCIIM